MCKSLQSSIASVVDHVPSKLAKHADYRKYEPDSHSIAFDDEINSREHANFIDGDLIEMFLDMDETSQIRYELYQQKNVLG